MTEATFRNKKIQQFWQETIKALPPTFQSAAHFILTRLDKKGDCPSVRTPERTPLETITLTDHTLRVTRNMQKTSVPGTPMYNCAIISALGHDISKIPGILPKNHFAKILHARKSADYLQRWLRDILEVREVDMIVETIFHHHDMEKATTLIDDLKAADFLARREETLLLGIEIINKGIDVETGKFIPSREGDQKWRGREKYTVDFVKEAPDPDAESVNWFDAVEFLVALKPKVNSLDWYTWGPEAISMTNDICYFTSNVIYNTFRELAIAKGWGPIEIIDNTEMNPQRKRNILAFIGKRLREEGYLATHELPPNYHVCEYVVTFHRGYPTQHIRYTPIFGRHFGDIITLQNRKVGTMYSRVSSIRRNWGKWRQHE